VTIAPDSRQQVKTLMRRYGQLLKLRQKSPSASAHEQWSGMTEVFHCDRAP
jgi:hypothetical protein